MALSEPVRLALGEASDLLWRARRALERVEHSADHAPGSTTAALCADLADATGDLYTQVDALLRQPECARDTDKQGGGRADGPGDG